MPDGKLRATVESQPPSWQKPGLPVLKREIDRPPCPLRSGVSRLLARERDRKLNRSIPIYPHSAPLPLHFIFVKTQPPRQMKLNILLSNSSKFRKKPNPPIHHFLNIPPGPPRIPAPPELLGNSTCHRNPSESTRARFPESKRPPQFAKGQTLFTLLATKKSTTPNLTPMSGSPGRPLPKKTFHHLRVNRRQTRRISGTRSETSSDFLVWNCFLSGERAMYQATICLSPAVTYFLRISMGLSVLRSAI